MSQNTLVIADGTGAQVLERMNNANNTLATLNSGSSAPATTYAYMLWADTTNNQLKMRNAANTGWNVVGSFDATSFNGTVADGSITEAKIATGAVTDAKLASNSVTTAKIADANVTPAKLSTGGPSWGSSGNLQFNSGYGSVATAYGCRAWVNFNGTGTAAIRASGNVSSITDNGTGNYTVNFTNAMPDVNYSLTVTGCDTTSGTTSMKVQSNTNSSGALTLYSTTQARVVSVSASGSAFDQTLVSVQVFR